MDNPWGSFSNLHSRDLSLELLSRCSCLHHSEPRDLERFSKSKLQLALAMKKARVLNNMERIHRKTRTRGFVFRVRLESGHLDVNVSVQFCIVVKFLSMICFRVVASAFHVVESMN